VAIPVEQATRTLLPSSLSSSTIFEAIHDFPAKILYCMKQKQNILLGTGHINQNNYLITKESYTPSVTQ
jgi:hypothetical protein